ncbi:MAG: aminotransferase class IV, partial [Persicimonas sp.]
MDEMGQTVSSDDRSYLWGDGLFETVKVRADGSVRWLDRHIERLRRSGAALGFDEARIDEAAELLAAVTERQPGLWRITVSRAPEAAPFGGEGSIRLRRRDSTEATRPRLGFAHGFYLPDDPLAEHKTTSFIRYVEARRRVERRGFDEAIL